MLYKNSQSPQSGIQHAHHANAVNTQSLNTLQSDKPAPRIQGRSKETQPEAVNSTKFSPFSSPEHSQMPVHS